jgi:hypothetical protein
MPTIRPQLVAATLGLVAALAAVPARAALRLPGFGRGASTVEMAVRELPAEEAWQVSYRLPAKAAGVEFVRPSRDPYRRATWSVVPAGATWVDVPAGADGTRRERLCFPTPTRELGVAFRSAFEVRRKDYARQVAMSDGGRLFFTGALLVRPLESCAPEAAAQPSPDAVVHRFRFSTAAGRTIRTVDGGATRTLEWRPAAGGEATYVYFGPQAAVAGERIALIADPALPEWMRHDLEPTMAKLFDRFAGETGIALADRPLVVVSFSPTGSGFTFAAGQLGRFLQLHLAGEGLRADTPETRSYWVKHLAHEVFHLWDGHVLRADAESEWLSEAAAEAFALRAAYGLGVFDERQIAARLVDLANLCLAGLDGQSLLSAPQRQAHDTWYSCGPVLLFVAGQAVERAHPGKGGLGLLVREMFAEGRAAGGVYGTGTFLGWLDKLSGDRPTVFALQGIIRRGVPRGADRVLAQLLTGAGYRVSLAPPTEAKAGWDVYRSLLQRGLTRCACGAGAIGSGDVAADGDCARLSGSARIVEIDDVEVRRDPAAAYGRLRAAAGLGRPLRVVAGEETPPLTLLCGRDTLDPSFDQLLQLE